MEKIFLLGYKTFTGWSSGIYGVEKSAAKGLNDPLALKNYKSLLRPLRGGGVKAGPLKKNTFLNLFLTKKTRLPFINVMNPDPYLFFGYGSLSEIFVDQN